VIASFEVKQIRFSVLRVLSGEALLLFACQLQS